MHSLLLILCLVLNQGNNDDVYDDVDDDNCLVLTKCYKEDSSPTMTPTGTDLELTLTRSQSIVLTELSPGKSVRKTKISWKIQVFLYM